MDPICPIPSPPPSRPRQSNLYFERYFVTLSINGIKSIENKMPMVMKRVLTGDSPKKKGGPNLGGGGGHVHRGLLKQLLADFLF